MFSIALTRGYLNTDIGIDGLDGVDEWACAGNMRGLFSNNPIQLLKIPTDRKINNNHNMYDWTETTSRSHEICEGSI